MRQPCESKHAHCSVRVVPVAVDDVAAVPLHQLVQVQSIDKRLQAIGWQAPGIWGETSAPERGVKKPVRRARPWLRRGRGAQHACEQWRGTREARLRGPGRDERTRMSPRRSRGLRSENPRDSSTGRRGESRGGLPCGITRLEGRAPSWSC